MKEDQKDQKSVNEEKNLSIPSGQPLKDNSLKAESTPRPWAVVDRRAAPLPNVLIIGGDQSHVAQAAGVHMRDKMLRWKHEDADAADARVLANAELIVRAVNTHDALVAAVKEAIPTITTYIEEIGGCDHSVGICCCDVIVLREQLGAALALANGQDTNTLAFER